MDTSYMDAFAGNHTAPSEPSVRGQSGLELTFLNGRPVAQHRLRSYGLGFAAKRGLDIVVSGGLLVVLAPVFVAIACIIRLESPGAAFFRQEREGFLRRRFDIVKFRTLYLEAQDLSGVSQVQAGDDRVTRVGRFLRRTSLDELPQLINILRGEMSLVGPRPHVPGMQAADRPYDVLVPYYRMRRLAKPGLTGWAQANGLRGTTENSARAIGRVDHDVAYIQNFSFTLDLRILILTFIRELQHFGRGH